MKRNIFGVKTKIPVNILMRIPIRRHGCTSNHSRSVEQKTRGAFFKAYFALPEANTAPLITASLN